MNLYEVVGSDFSFLVKLIDSFLEDAPKILAALDKAVGAPDFKEIQRLAHSLKSNANDFGAVVFARRCKELEDKGRDGQKEGTSRLYAEILAEYKILETTLIDIRNQGATAFDGRDLPDG